MCLTNGGTELIAHILPIVRTTYYMPKFYTYDPDSLTEKDISAI